MIYGDNVVSGPYIPSDSPYNSAPASAPIEMIDIVFALSNIKLVREIVQDNLKQVEDLAKVGKGQTEGLRSMIMEKQKNALKDIGGVEKVLNEIVEGAIAPQRNAPNRNVSLSPEHSQALIYGLSFAIGHLMKFMPVQGGGEMPGTIV